MPGKDYKFESPIQPLMRKILDEPDTELLTEIKALRAEIAELRAEMKAKDLRSTTVMVGADVYTYLRFLEL